MAPEEMKKKVKLKIDAIDESQLKLVVDFIEKVESSKVKEWKLMKHIDEIIEERGDVLKRLAR